MADLEFRPEDYARPRPRHSAPRGGTEHLEFHPEDYLRGRPRRRGRHGGAGPEGKAPWIALGIGILAGAAALYYMNAPDHRPTYRDSAPHVARRRRRRAHAVAGRTVTIGKPRSEVYAFWRDPQNLTFMENVERVEKIGDDGKRQRWTIAAPAGQTVTIESEITDERPGERIAWASVEGSPIETRGRVEFRDAPGDRGTEVSAEIEYVPPGGTLGRMVAKLFQREPQVQVRHDLKRLKMLMETGEIATSQNRKSE